MNKLIAIFSLIAVLLTAMVTGAQARIGETLAECETRYGKPKFSSKDKREHDFKTPLYVVQITLDKDGRVYYIWYDTKGVPGSELTDEIVAELLQKNSDTKWTKTLTTKKDVRFSTKAKDGRKLNAIYHHEEGYLEIWDVETSVAAQAAKKAGEKAKKASELDKL